MVDRALERIDADLDKLYAGMGRRAPHSSRSLRRVGCRGRSHFRNLTPDLFHHKLSVTRITDFQPGVPDNEGLIGAVRGVPVSQDGPRSCPKPIFSAL